MLPDCRNPSTLVGIGLCEWQALSADAYQRDMQTLLASECIDVDLHPILAPVGGSAAGCIGEFSDIAKAITVQEINPVGRAIYFRADLEPGLIGRVAKSMPHAVNKE